ncbi:hypothetical protein [Lysobacter sp. HA35]
MTVILAACSLFLAIALIPALAMAAYAHWRVSQHLQLKHPTVWATIAPAPGTEPSASSPYARFISQRRYVELQDPELTRIAQIARRQLNVVVGMLVALAVSGSAYSWLGAR